VVIAMKQIMQPYRKTKTLFAGIVKYLTAQSGNVRQIIVVCLQKAIHPVNTNLKAVWGSAVCKAGLLFNALPHPVFLQHHYRFSGDLTLRGFFTHGKQSKSVYERLVA
jgi:hypothetical protein